jgi:hypothetical protein
MQPQPKLPANVQEISQYHMQYKADQGSSDQLTSRERQYIERNNAYALARMGAKRYTIEGLTGLTRQMARDVIKEVTNICPRGKHLSSSDYFHKDPFRLNEADLFLRFLNRQEQVFAFSRSTQFIAAYGLYDIAVNKTPVLDVNYAYLVMELLEKEQLAYKKCGVCQSVFLDLIDNDQPVCHTCEKHSELFCDCCGMPYPKSTSTRGRPREYCPSRLTSHNPVGRPRLNKVDAI